MRTWSTEPGGGRSEAREKSPSGLCRSGLIPEGLKSEFAVTGGSGETPDCTEGSSLTPCWGYCS